MDENFKTQEALMAMKAIRTQKKSCKTYDLLSQVDYATKLLTSFGITIVLVDMRLGVVGLLKAEFLKLPQYNLSLIFGWDNLTRVELCKNKFVIAQWSIPQILLPTVMQGANNLVNELNKQESGVSNSGVRIHNRFRDSVLTLIFNPYLDNE